MDFLKAYSKILACHDVNLVRNSRIKDSLKETLQSETQYNKPG